MATRYIGTASEIIANAADVVGAASGGTLAGSQIVQVVFDDTKFGATQEGKQKLVSALEMIVQRIQSARTYPITSAS